jgi:SAM-dependent methyltransferase
MTLSNEPVSGEAGSGPGPSAWVRRWLATPSGSGRLLDFASGEGRHVALARAAGYRVTAADRDVASLTRAARLGADPLAVDLESDRWPFVDQRFEVVLMTRYLFRPRLPLLAALVEPGGFLIVETFALGQAAWGRPRNPAFLLRPDESFDVCRRAGLLVLGFEQGVTEGPTAIQRITATRPPSPARIAPITGASPPLG